MMYNVKRILLIIICTITIIASFANYGVADQKANEFMKAGMYSQAIALLEKKINEKPADGVAHFQLAVCYILTQNYTKADERFASAVRLNSDFE